MEQCSNETDYFTKLTWSLTNLPNVYIYYLDLHKTSCYKRTDLYKWFSENDNIFEFVNETAVSDKIFFKMPDGSFVQNIKILDSINIKYIAVPIVKKGYFTLLNNPKTAKQSVGYLLLNVDNLKNGLVNYLMMNFKNYTVSILLRSSIEELIDEIQSNNS